MPAWARALPKEILDKGKNGFVLFPTISVPRGVGVSGNWSNPRKGGIVRKGHPVLKLEVGERDRDGGVEEGGEDGER